MSQSRVTQLPEPMAPNTPTIKQRLSRFLQKHDVKLLMGVTAAVSFTASVGAGIGVLTALAIGGAAAVAGLFGCAVAGGVGFALSVIPVTIANVVSSALGFKKKNTLTDAIIKGTSVISTACAIGGMAAGGYVGHNFGTEWFPENTVQTTFNKAAEKLDQAATITYDAARQSIDAQTRKQQSLRQ